MDRPSDRLPPFSLEAEAGVLGCCLLSPPDCIAECVDSLHSSLAFYDLRHRTIYESLVEMQDTHTAIDLLTVQQRLKDRKKLREAGGLVYLASLPDCTPSAENLPHYLEIVRKKALLRRVIASCSTVISKAYEDHQEADTLVEEADVEWRAAIDSTQTQTVTRCLKDLMPGAMEAIDRLHKGEGKPSGLSTGLIDLDKMTGGLNPCELFVIAGRPGTGKTAIATNVAEHIAVELKQPVGIFSLEMSSDALMLRLLSSRARVNLRHAYNGGFTAADFSRLAKAGASLVTAPIYISDARGLSILQLRAKARRMKQRHNIKVFIIDYIQLLSAGRRSENRNQEITAISNGIQSLAGELKVPFIVLSQLNREFEKRGPNSKPRLSDLRESGAIEQDGDVVALLYRSTSEEDEHAQAIKVNLMIAKQRNGPTGEIPLVFLRNYTRFESAAKIEAEPVEQTPSLPYHD